MLVVNDMEFAGKKLKAITTDRIQEIVECYGKAAARCTEAGYDCLEFHCAHNYLPHSFLSGGLNHRTDEYGGSFENRSRFPLECIRAIRNAIPEEMPLFMRIDAHDDYLPGGLTIEEIIEFCRIAGENGVDVLDVSREISSRPDPFMRFRPSIFQEALMWRTPHGSEERRRWRRSPWGGSTPRSRRKPSSKRIRPIWSSWGEPSWLIRSSATRRGGQDRGHHPLCRLQPGLLRRILRFKEQTVYHMSEKSVSGSRGGVEAYKGGDSETGLYRRRRNGRPGGGQGAAHEAIIR